LDWLLGTVNSKNILCGGLVRFIVADTSDIPDGALLAPACPMTLAALSDSVPTWFVLPMIVATAGCKTLFAPNDRGADFEASGFQRQLTLGDIFARVPDIGDVTGKEHPRLTPI